jgi:hypothetical protein
VRLFQNFGFWGDKLYLSGFLEIGFLKSASLDGICFVSGKTLQGFGTGSSCSQGKEIL